MGDKEQESSGLRKLLTDQRAMYGAGLLAVWGVWAWWPVSASCDGWDDTLSEMYFEDMRNGLTQITTEEGVDNFLNQDFRLVGVRTLAENTDVNSVVCEASLQGRKVNRDGSLGESVDQIARLEYESYVDSDGEVWVSLHQ